MVEDQYSYLAKMGQGGHGLFHCSDNSVGYEILNPYVWSTAVCQLIRPLPGTGVTGQVSWP